MPSDPAMPRPTAVSVLGVGSTPSSDEAQLPITAGGVKPRVKSTSDQESLAPTSSPPTFHTPNDVAAPNRADIISPVVLRPGTRERGHFMVLQAWEGRVTDVHEETFWARLVDKTNGGPEEEAKFYVDDVSADDRDLLQTGGVFYWSVGYFDSATGERLKSSLIRFRRLPAWSHRTIAELERRVDEVVGEPNEADAAG